MLISIRPILGAVSKWTGSFFLGGTILWGVARDCDLRNGIVYVHVSAAGVEVTLDDSVYHVDSPWGPPIVCVRPPGRHTLRMRREGTMLYEETFALEPGQDLVLCAFESRAGRDRSEPEPRPSSRRPMNRVPLTPAAPRRRP